VAINVINQVIEDTWAAYNGDSTEVLKGIPDNSIGMSVFSPPFASLYTYSNSERDLGNCKKDGQFYTHFKFIVGELYRVLMPGRIVAFHCMNIPAMKERDGYIGLKDFRGDLIRMFEAAGFIFHSEHCIWKDPLIEATRTKAIGLMHKQLCKDSIISRSGIPDYLIAMRKKGDNPQPVAHADGITYFVGENPPKEGVMSHERWRRYASPVWMDIDQTNTLQYMTAREQQDERHICPLQLDVIERAVYLWSNEGDSVLSPFMGIGSEGHVALKMGRRFIGCELKRSYFDLAVKNLKHAADISNQQHGLFAESVAGD
jgi:DNA modification methylase